MPRTKLSLSKETLAELTADEMAAVNGAAGDSNSCSCTIAVVCIGQYAQFAMVAPRTAHYQIQLGC